MSILYLDLGNTRLKYWLLDGKHVIKSHAQEHLKAPNELLLGLADTFNAYHPTFIGVSSVLGDKLNDKIAQTLTQLNAPFKFAHVNAHHPRLLSHYDPSQLGVDRWLQMLGAVNSACQQCVIGCGTALTIDLIDQGTHLGGYILPNAYMQRHALYAGTHQIAVKAGRFLDISLGRTTFDAVNHGILFGILSSVVHIQRLYPSYEIILTGGGAMMLQPHLTDVTVNDDLLLTGLKRYFQDILPLG